MNRLQTATLSAAYNIALQISLRIVTFVSNAFILRYISKDILGLVNVRLLLLYTTIQFTSREAFRRTCVSKTKGEVDVDKRVEKTITKPENILWKEVVNVIYLTVPITIVNGLFFSTWWFKWMHLPEERLVPHYFYGIISIYLSVIIESLAEPFYIYGQRNDFIRLKVVIEGIFQLVRCLLFTICVYHSSEDAILGFAFAQLIASIVYLICYFSYFIVAGKMIIWDFIPNLSLKPKFNPTLLRTSFSFFLNTVLKQFLTEGERYIMTLFAVFDFAEQGIYDVINNLGSLPARLVFQQIEENAYLLFTNIVKRELPANKQKKEIVESLNTCASLVKFMLLLGLFLFVYGYNCTQLVLFIYGGPGLVMGKYGSLAVRLFQWHCFYIIFIALNGILESYSFATMSVVRLNRFNMLMLFVSGSYLGLSFVTIHWFGSEGFIMANCFNMLLRIGISIKFIGLLNDHGSTTILTFIRKCSPDRMVMLSFGIIFFMVYNARNILIQDLSTQQSIWLQSGMFVGFTAILVIIHLSFIYYREKELVHFIRTKAMPGRGQTQQKTTKTS